MSREDAESLLDSGNFPENSAVISFSDPSLRRIDSDYTHVDYGCVCDKILYIELDDLDIDALCESGLTYDTYFTEASDVARFVLEADSRGMDIVCQCEYGQSRSAGCAAAIAEYFYRDGISIFSDYRYFPNKVIYHKLFDALCAEGKR